MSIVSNISEVPSLDEQNNNAPGLAPFDADFEQWLDEHEQPITPEEDEAAYREWLQEQALTENHPARPVKPRYFMIRVEGKGKTAWFEIRRDTDGEWVAIIRGRAEAQRELDKLNSVA